MPKSPMFRLNPELYERFKSLVGVSGYTVTGALEKFMGSSVENGALGFRARGSKNIRCRMSKVKFDFSTVRTRVIPILRHVEVEDYLAKIGRVYGWSKQHVNSARLRRECKLEGELVDRLDQTTALLKTGGTDTIKNACIAYLKKSEKGAKIGTMT